MPKSRKNRPGNKNKAKRVRVNARLRNLVTSAVKNQATLDAWLLQESDPIKRRAMYERVRPLLHFQSEFPSTIERPTILRP